MMTNQFIEKEIVIEGETKIFGTLNIPSATSSEEKYPAILFLSGSGPIDRNANGPKGKFQMNVYKELAEYITRLGFVTFRYDKRGTGKREEDFMSAGFWDFVNDSERSFLFLQNHPNVDRNKIIVLGHSEGTIIGTALSERQPINGLMLVSAGVGNLEEFLVHQRTLAYQELRDLKGLKGMLMRKLINDEKQEAKVAKQTKKMFDSNKDVYKVLGIFKQPAKWYKEHFAYDPRSALQKVTCPVLAIHGDKDPLVDSSLLEELASLVKGKSEYYIIKDMEHGLRVQTEEKSVLNVKKMYKVINRRPLNQAGLDVISKWLVSNYKEDGFHDQ